MRRSYAFQASCEVAIATDRLTSRIVIARHRGAPVQQAGAEDLAANDAHLVRKPTVGTE